MPEAIPSIDLIDEIRADIAHNNVQLPTLPEVALRVRDEVESETGDAHTIARIVSCDPALAARLLQVANSPLYGGRREIDCLDEAVARLGIRLVRSLVTSLVMKQIFQATSRTLDREFRKIWADSLQIAAISRVLARHVPSLETEEAMLGGLVYNIGALPLLTKLEQYQVGDANPALIQAMIDGLAPDLGSRILDHWHFVDAMTVIPSVAVEPTYDSGPAPTYADIVIVARLHHLAGRDGDWKPDWSLVPALGKLGLDEAGLAGLMREQAQGLSEIEGLFRH